ncbi:MAG: endonuclease [Candidatus Diapherotrites archaeon]|uniref:Endonuclease n=1 Tax=Candidatus Iainarchaeum sp. TaxID=3101447 RepID=A0A2D6LQA7_9ARCH|nr:endonuclease [Candidatus Diapherotrites archaeon]
MPDLIFLLVLVAAIILFLLVLFLLSRLSSLEQRLSELKFSKSSQSVKYGKMTEQFIPFTKDFPFNPDNFRFLGNPIDGVIFEEDKVIFAEFKTASSQLSQKQRNIRDLVKSKKVEWFEYKLK